jgi:hypothetical protein
MVSLEGFRRLRSNQSNDSGSALNHPRRRHKRLITLLNFVFDGSFESRKNVKRYLLQNKYEPTNSI